MWNRNEGSPANRSGRASFYSGVGLSSLRVSGGRRSAAAGIEHGVDELEDGALVGGWELRGVTPASCGSVLERAALRSALLLGRPACA
jgi:hypothetical protein